MGTRVDFVRLEEGGAQPRRLFTLREFETRIVSSGPELGDAIVVLRRPVEIAERRIPRDTKPMEWIAHLPASYDQAALTAGAPERDETALLDVLTRERTLLAFQDVRHFFCLDGGTIRDADGEQINLLQYRRAVIQEGWETLIPFPLILEALSPKLPTPTLDELTRSFFAELEKFRREYPNWTSLYRKGEVWEKVLFGTPEELIPKGATEIDRGLFGRMGAQHYPRIERGLFGNGQVWRRPHQPGSALASLEVCVLREADVRLAPQRLLDLAALRIPLKIFITRVRINETERRSREFHDLLRHNGGLVEGERFFIIFAPPSETPNDPWHLVKADPASGKPWLFSAWG